MTDVQNNKAGLMFGLLWQLISRICALNAKGALKSAVTVWRY